MIHCSIYVTNKITVIQSQEDHLDITNVPYLFDVVKLDTQIAEINSIQNSTNTVI